MILKKFFDMLRGMEITDDFYEDLEEQLIMADVGASCSDGIIERLKTSVRENNIKKCEDCKKMLMDSIEEMMKLDEDPYEAEEERSVYMLIGVNGVGKTTTCGKLAYIFEKKGRKVLLAAADTFRAAAIDQLKIWSERSGAELISGREGADPGAVIFDACSAAKARNTDVIIADTAGRLHNKTNLMAELKKLYGIIDRELPEHKRETLIVLDATTGQNAVEQAREFSRTADITGIVLTKMDGTAKGGVAAAIQSELGIPVKYVGYGEKAEDLKKFDVKEYVRGLFE